MNEKLKEIKNIEKELGVNIITLFKALKDGFYKKNLYNGEITFSGNYKDIKNNGTNLVSYIYVDKKGKIDIILGNPNFGISGEDFKDFGKTLALTKEELM